MKFFDGIRKFTIPFGPLHGKVIKAAPRHGIKKLLGIYEPQLNKIFKKYVDAEAVCIDVGSHVGYWTLLMRKYCGNDGYIMSVEPLDEGCNLQKDTFQLNNYKNIFVEKTAVGEKDKTMTAHVFKDSSMANFHDSGLDIYDKNEKGTEFKITTLDNLVKKHKLKTVKFVKIDIEGYESNAIRGFTKTLKTLSPILLVEAHTYDNYEKCWNILKEHSYKIYDLSGNLLSKNHKNNPEIFHFIAKKE